MTHDMRFPTTFREQSEQSEQMPSDQEGGSPSAFVSTPANKANKSEGRRRWLDRATERPAWADSTQESRVDTATRSPQSKHPAGWSDRLNRQVYKPVPGQSNQWREMTASTTLCIWCPEPIAEGDKTSCMEHRRRRDATPMPWEKAEREESA